nr:hypothetical protein [Tanacetum cinerariifolium]
MTKQEREAMLYDEFDKFTSEPEESFYSYYLTFSKLINDMNMILMSMTPMQISTKFMNHFQFEWSSEGHMAKQCTAKKKVKDFKWYKDKRLLDQAQELQATTNFKADHVDAYDSDYDDEATTNAIFKANLSPAGSLNDDMAAPRYDSDTLSKVPYYDTYHDSDMLNSNIQELGYIENIVSNNDLYDELKGNNNVISYTDYMLTIGDDAKNDVPLLVQKNDMMLSVIEQMRSQVDKCNKVNQEAKSVNESLTSELERYKDRVGVLGYAVKDGHSEQQAYLSQVKEIKDIFEQMEDEVDQCSMAKKQLLINNDLLLEENISSDIMCFYLRSLNEVDNYGKCKSLDIVLLDIKESNKSLCELRKCFAKLEEYNITLDIAFQNHKEKMILNDSNTKNKQLLVKTINNQSVEKKDLKVKLQDKLHVINELKHLFAQKSQKTWCELTAVDSRIQKIEDENVSLAFQVIPKVVEKNDLSKSVTSQLTTNKIIEKCTKVLALGLHKIETEPINAYFKNNRIVRRDYIKVTKEHVATLQELLEQARALKPLDE